MAALFSAPSYGSAVAAKRMHEVKTIVVVNELIILLPNKNTEIEIILKRRSEY